MDWKNVLGSLLENADLPAGEEPTPEATPAKTPALPTLHVLIDRKGRKGKTATIVEGFDPDIPDETERIAALLKRSLGVGGSTRGGGEEEDEEQKYETIHYFTRECIASCMRLTRSGSTGL